jgi:hypothetical protein
VDCAELLLYGSNSAGQFFESRLSTDITNEYRSETRSNERKQFVATKIMYYTTKASAPLLLRGEMSQSWQDESVHRKNTTCVLSSPKSFRRGGKKNSAKRLVVSS